MSRFHRLFKKNYSCQKEPNRNDKALCYFRINLFICVFGFIFVVAYLAQVNSITKLGYEDSELENKADTLEEINNKLELEAVNLQSISAIQNILPEFGLVLIDKISYINNNDLAVAVVK